MTELVDSPWDRLLGHVLPPRCVLCNRRGQPPCFDLCVACEAELPVAPDGGFRTEDPPPDAERSVACDRWFAVCAYAPPVDTMIQALKYGGQLAVGRVLGRLLARGAADLGLHLDVDCVLPVPLHPRRYADRGFNQSVEIARYAARGLSLPVEPRLAVRCRDTRPQVGLATADRHANLRGAFAATAGDVRGRRIAVVDDVMTTGSTVAELACVLRHAGAASVDGWCVACATLDSGSRIPQTAR